MSLFWGNTKETGFKGNRLPEYWTRQKPLCPAALSWGDVNIYKLASASASPRERKSRPLPYKRSRPHTEASPWGGYPKSYWQTGLPTTLYWRQFWESTWGNWVRMWNPSEHLLFLPSHCKLHRLWVGRSQLLHYHRTSLYQGRMRRFYRLSMAFYHFIHYDYVVSVVSFLWHKLTKENRYIEMSFTASPYA